MVCPHGQGGLSQCGHFSDKGEEGQFLAILCGRLLWTAPYEELNVLSRSLFRDWIQGQNFAVSISESAGLNLKPKPRFLSQQIFDISVLNTSSIHLRSFFV